MSWWCTWPLLLMAVNAEVSAQMVPPRLTPKTETGYIVVQAGDTFQIQCESKSPIKWTYPVYSNPESKASLNITRRMEPNWDFQYKSTLKVSSAIYMDTGYYYCNIEGSDGNVFLSDDSTSKIYVFVNDSHHLLVPGESVVLADKHKSNEIPCRPTSPDIEVSLINEEVLLGTWDGTSFQIDPDATDFAHRLSFSPQVGFTVKFSSFQDEGLYVCVGKRGNNYNETAYIFHILPDTETPPAPIIQLISEGRKRIKEKHTFSLNCSVNVSSDVKFVLSWDTPNNIAADDGRLIYHSTESFKFTEGGREVLVGHKLLTVKKASKNDTGIYTCIIVDHNELKNSENFYVEVYECENGIFGKNCSMLCNDNCMQYCNKDNGSCVLGCKPGWKGDTCNTECDIGLYGIGCRKKCNGKCKDDETCNAVDGHCSNGCEEGFAGKKCDLQPLSTLSIILISIGALAFVLMGIGLIYAIAWILRLRRERTKSLEIRHDSPPQIGSTHQPTRQEIQRADSVIYDEILENETNREIEPCSSLDINLMSTSVGYNKPGKSIQSTSKRSLDIEDEDDYLNAISTQAGSSAPRAQQAIPFRPGDVSSTYADVLNLSDNQTVAEYEYIRFQGKKL